jgi:hypothetical protein
MDVAVLVVGILSLVAAAAAAVFAYPAWRAAHARPKLVLSATRREQNNLGDGRRAVSIEVTISNAGNGDAIGWKVEIESRTPGTFTFENPRPDGIHAVAIEDGIRIEWQSTGADDAIGPDLSRRARIRPADFHAGEVLRARFTLTAARMESVRGAIVVAWPDGEKFAAVGVV